MNLGRLLDHLSFPIIYLLNRPLFDRFNRLVLMFAYRINGMGIAWRSRRGIEVNEDRFLSRFRRAIDGGAVFDVGANRGDYARALRSYCPNTRITCFEPQPATFKSLAGACGALGIKLENFALGAKVHSAVLYELEGARSSTIASLTSATLKTHGRIGKQFEVSVDTLDDYCERHGVLALRLLKIDTEGHDLDVLRGARRMLASGAIDIIEFEFIPANLYTNVHFYQFVEILEGYDLFRLCLNGDLTPLLPYDWRFSELYMIYNVIAIRRGFRPAGRS